MPHFRPRSISRLNKQFKNDYENWQKRDVHNLKIVYVWADGIYLKAGIADAQAMFVGHSRRGYGRQKASVDALGRLSGIGRELVSGIE